MQRRAKRSVKLCSQHSFCLMQRGHLLQANHALPVRLTWHALVNAAQQTQREVDDLFGTAFAAFDAAAIPASASKQTNSIQTP